MVLIFLVSIYVGNVYLSLTWSVLYLLILIGLIFPFNSFCKSSYTRTNQNSGLSRKTIGYLQFILFRKWKERFLDYHQDSFCWKFSWNKRKFFFLYSRLELPLSQTLKTRDWKWMSERENQKRFSKSFRGFHSFTSEWRNPIQKTFSVGSAFSRNTSRQADIGHDNQLNLSYKESTWGLSAQTSIRKLVKFLGTGYHHR